MKNILKIFMIVLFMINLVSCSNKENVDELTQAYKDLDQAYKDAEETMNRVHGQKNPEDITDIDILLEISPWVTENLWNNAICTFYHYYAFGDGPTGDVVDFDFALREFKKNINVAADIDEFIENLSDEYDEVKYLWSKIYTETLVLYDLTADRGDSPCSGDYPSGKFKQYKDAFDDEINRLSNDGLVIFEFE